MLPHLRRIFPHSVNNCRHLRSSCIQLADEKVSYKEGKVEITETTPKSFRTHHVPKLERWLDRYHFDRWDLSTKAVRHSVQRYLRKRQISDQTLNRTRLKMLGRDLSAATFITYRGGVVKFVGYSKLFGYNDKELLPKTKDESFLLEAIDTNGVELYYEGLDHFKDLEYLKWLSFRGSSMFNNWYLDRLSHIVPKVEYLDLSYCRNINKDALHCIYRMKSLKCLNIEGISNSIEFQLSALTLESEKPDLTVLGVINKPAVKSAFDIDPK